MAMHARRAHIELQMTQLQHVNPPPVEGILGGFRDCQRHARINGRSLSLADMNRFFPPLLAVRG